MKYQKKQIVVDAIQYDGTKESFQKLKELGLKYEHIKPSGTNVINEFSIATLEGDMQVCVGDYVVKEPFPTKEGREFYPVKPEIFAKTYIVNKPKVRVIDEGHSYELKNFEDDTYQRLFFIKKKPDPQNPGELLREHYGTTNEAVIEMLIDRLTYLQGKFPCKENACAITHLEEALMWLEKRTIKRVKQGVEGKHKAHE